MRTFPQVSVDATQQQIRSLMERSCCPPGSSADDVVYVVHRFSPQAMAFVNAMFPNAINKQSELAAHQRADLLKTMVERIKFASTSHARSRGIRTPMVLMLNTEHLGWTEAVATGVAGRGQHGDGATQVATDAVEQSSKCTDIEDAYSRSRCAHAGLSYVMLDFPQRLSPEQAATAFQIVPHQGRQMLNMPPMQIQVMRIDPPNDRLYPTPQEWESDPAAVYEAFQRGWRAG